MTTRNFQSSRRPLFWRPLLSQPLRWLLFWFLLSPAGTVAANLSPAGAFDRFIDDVNLLSPEFIRTAGSRIAGIIETQKLTAVQRRMLSHLLRQLQERDTRPQKNGFDRLRLRLEALALRTNADRAPVTGAQKPAGDKPERTPARATTERSPHRRDFQGQRSARFLK